jgi:hypothetical protein
MSYFSNFKTIPYDLNGDGVFDNITNLTSLVAASQKLLDNQVFYGYVQVLDGERPDQLSQRLYGTPQYYWSFILINKNIKNVWNDWPKNSAQLLEYSVYKYADFAALACNTTDDLLGKFIMGEYVQGVLSGAIGQVIAVHTNDKYVVLKLISGTFRMAGEDIYGLESQDTITATEIVSRAYAPAYHVDDSTGDITAPRLAGTSKVTNLDHEGFMNDRNRYVKAVKPDRIADFVAEFNKEMQ